MEQRRTDLALEARELWQERAGETSQLEGVEARTGEREGFLSETVHILDERGEQALGKPAGTYVTLTMDGLQRREEDAFGRGARAVAGVLRELMGPEGEKGGALVVGLGNRAITPDAVGPKVHEHTLVTRHLVEGVPEHFGSFRPVASLAAGVLGTTGMESGELVQAVCRSLKPAWVIAVDALASRSLERLCRTVQISDTGIVPGSGVGNHRFALDEKTLGVPVLAVGVPTVVYGATLAADLLGRDDLPPPGPGGRAAGHPQGHRQPGGGPLQGHRLRHQPGPPARSGDEGPGSAVKLGHADIGTGESGPHWCSTGQKSLRSGADAAAGSRKLPLSGVSVCAGMGDSCAAGTGISPQEMGHTNRESKGPRPGKGCDGDGKGNHSPGDFGQVPRPQAL